MRIKVSKETHSRVWVLQNEAKFISLFLLARECDDDEFGGMEITQRLEGTGKMAASRKIHFSSRIVYN